MKVLMVHDVGRLTGGAEIQVQREISALGTRGLEVRVVVGHNHGETLSFGDYTFPTPGGSLPKLAMLYNQAAGRAVRSAVADFCPDVVHYHTLTKASPTVLRQAGDRPRVVTLHDYAVVYPLLVRVLPPDEVCGVGDFACCRVHAGGRFYFEQCRTALIRRELKQVAAIIVPSRFLAQVARSLGLGDPVVVPGSISAGIQPVGAKAREIAYVGRLEREKGVLELIREFALLSATVPDVRLTIAGAGQLEGVVREAAAELGNRVAVVGQVSTDEARRILARAAVTVVPSLWPEPFGLVGPESMACGTPVVASGRGGISEWLDHGQNGLCADPTQPGATAEALRRLLTDNEFWSKCVHGALRTAAAFNSSSHAAMLEELYVRLLTPRSAR